LEVRDVGRVVARKSSRNGESAGTTTAPRSRRPPSSRDRNQTFNTAIDALVATIGIDSMSTP
jgi:hypothetical protein